MFIIFYYSALFIQSLANTVKVRMLDFSWREKKWQWDETENAVITCKREEQKNYMQSSSKTAFNYTMIRLLEKVSKMNKNFPIVIMFKVSFGQRI